jgi:hypothetical protein
LTEISSAQLKATHKMILTDGSTLFAESVSRVIDKLRWALPELECIGFGFSVGTAGDFADNNHTNLRNNFRRYGVISGINDSSRGYFDVGVSIRLYHNQHFVVAGSHGYISYNYDNGGNVIYCKTADDNTVNDYAYHISIYKTNGIIESLF